MRFVHSALDVGERWAPKAAELKGTPMREALLAVGGLAAALGASTCCVLPLALGTLGLGGAWLSTLTALAPYRIGFSVLAIVLLGVGFWLTYGSRPAINDVLACTPAPGERATKAVLWAGAAVMGLVLSTGIWERWAA